jgi:hypothetical protein
MGSIPGGFELGLWEPAYAPTAGERPRCLTKKGKRTSKPKARKPGTAGDSFSRRGRESRGRSEFGRNLLDGSMNSEFVDGQVKLVFAVPGNPNASEAVAARAMLDLRNGVGSQVVAGL